jgi:hypothetical protein
MELWRIAMLGAIGLAMAAGAAAAETSKPAGQAACRKAEINPVTGHVFCFDPLGAPVEPLPSEAKPACKPEDARGQWSWAPNCAPEPGEM